MTTIQTASVSSSGHSGIQRLPLTALKEPHLTWFVCSSVAEHLLGMWKVFQFQSPASPIKRYQVEGGRKGPGEPLPVQIGILELDEPLG